MNNIFNLFWEQNMNDIKTEQHENIQVMSEEELLAGQGARI